MIKLSAIIFAITAILFLGGYFFILDAGIFGLAENFRAYFSSNAGRLYADAPAAMYQDNSPEVFSLSSEIQADGITANDEFILDLLPGENKDPWSDEASFILVDLPPDAVATREANEEQIDLPQDIVEEFFNTQSPPEIFEEKFSLDLPQTETEATPLSENGSLNVGGLGSPPANDNPLADGGDLAASSTPDSFATTTPITATTTLLYFGSAVINEIAWSGNATSSFDEWIELYNISDKIINLASSTLISVTDNSPKINLNGLIKPGEYFLLERTNDETVSDLPADQIYTGALNNTGEILELRDGLGNLIDKVSLNFENKWPAGTAAPSYLSMERVNPYLPADIPGNWQSNSTTTRNGLDAGGRPLNGTPKAQNSVFNPGFFWLYPIASTTATSTHFEWTKSYLPDFYEYKILRSADSLFEIASTTIVAATSSISFFDATLESVTDYFYKISACDVRDDCIFSNIASTTTLVFPVFWSDPRLIWEFASSTEATSTDLLFDLALDLNGQISIVWLNASSTATSTEIIVFNNKSRPYKFWVGADQKSIYFSYQKSNGDWRGEKKIVDLAEPVSNLRAVVDSKNQAHLAWFSGENKDRIYSIFSGVE